MAQPELPDAQPDSQTSLAAAPDTANTALSSASLAQHDDNEETPVPAAPAKDSSAPVVTLRSAEMPGVDADEGDLESGEEQLGPTARTAPASVSLGLSDGEQDDALIRAVTALVDSPTAAEPARQASTSTVDDIMPGPPPPPPHRRRSSAQPPKGILKPPSVAQARFSFKRDILQPFNSRLAYAHAAYTASARAAPDDVAQQQQPDPSSAPVSQQPAAGTSSAPQSPPPQQQGSFWGSALKRLSASVVDTSSAALAAGAPGSSATAGPSRARSSSTASNTSVASATSSTARAPPQLSVADLRTVRFRMASLSVVYPINGPGGPLAPSDEAPTRRRVNREYLAARHRRQSSLSRRRASVGSAPSTNGETTQEKMWTSDELDRLYWDCCRTREERGIVRVREAFKANRSRAPTTIEIKDETLPLGAFEALSDLLSVDFGLKKLTLEGCGLEDASLKPLLNALLISGTVSSLSLANNKKIRSRGWRLLAIFLSKARFLSYLDLSENIIDKRACELLVQAISAPSSPPLSPPTSPASSLPSLQDTEVSANGDNSIDDEVEWDELLEKAPLLRDDGPVEPASIATVRLENCGLRNNQALEVLAHGVRSSSIKHISLRRNKVTALGAVGLAVMIRDYELPADGQELPLPVPRPYIAASDAPHNSLTATQALVAAQRQQSPRTSDPANEAQTEGPAEKAPLVVAQAEREAWLNSNAHSRMREQIEQLPRTGSLLTLDVKGNDIRSGVSYIAQVLKRNRTLKVLNLSENKVDSKGLASLAEALKYNCTLETLDLSRNPCCGPSLEGLMALRSALTINRSLKRLFLNGCDLTSQGAIALAEFLPEAASLIHLDLTDNHEIDIAGVMALSVAVKMNTSLRCLDLNIPPNDSDFARLSQEILQCCVRNTEHAQEAALARGTKPSTIATPLLNSTVARDLRLRRDKEERTAQQNAALSRSHEEILAASQECRDVLEELLEQGALSDEAGPSDLAKDVLVQAQVAHAQLAEVIEITASEEHRDRAVALTDDISSLLDRASAASPSSSPSVDDRRDLSPERAKDSPMLRQRLAGKAPPSISIPDATPAAYHTSPRSPLDRTSRELVAEEGEIFRKGHALNVCDSDDESHNDVSGEDLRREILEADVERNPSRSPSIGSPRTPRSRSTSSTSLPSPQVQA